MRSLLRLAPLLLLALLPPARQPAPASEPSPASESEPTKGTLPPARNEPSDIGLRPLLIGAAATIAVLGALLGIAAFLYPLSLTDRSIALPLPRFPAPALQVDPAADMAAFRARQMRMLNTAYWIDREKGVVHLPIAQAMQDVARGGIPDWPTK